MPSTCCTPKVEHIRCKCQTCKLHDMIEYERALGYSLPTLHEDTQQPETTTNDSDITVQSAVEAKVEHEDSGLQVETNVNFSDQVEQYQLLVGKPLSDPTYEKANSQAVDLTTFMSRPIRIFSKIWEVNESPQYVNAINPWDLFLSDPKVANKIETFKLLHGTLKLKIMVNGSPFHYGRMFVGLRPTKFDNNTLTDGPVTPGVSLSYTDENAAGSNKTMNNMACLYSQRPHVFIDPSTNQPQQISWPFFAATNWIDLTDQETIDRMGVLEIWELTQLQHSNGATDEVEISIFAWMEDVEFAGLTAAAPATAQMAVDKIQGSNKTKKRKPKKKAKPTFTNISGEDEHKPNGVVSAPAALLADFAGYFTEIPYIGKFAKSTQIASGAVSSIARLFGFSRPAVLTDTAFYKSQPIGNLANTSGADPIFKLTLDPKQELTIDPTTVGLGEEDQMSFGYLIKREAFIDYFNWSTIVAQNTGLLYSIQVHPMIAPIYQTGANDTVVRCQTPLSFVSYPFNNWSGSLRYRFQIVASQYHRGRLLFVYEPTLSTTGTVTDTNDRYSHIVDISEERDVTFEINWTQKEAYRKIDIFRAQKLSAWEGPTGAIGTDADDVANCNGRLNVYVLNALAAPITDSSVSVNVFISGGDSYEVRNPRGTLGQDVAYANSTTDVGPPTLAQMATEGMTVDENLPEQDTTYVLNGEYTEFCKEQSHVYYGEAVVSFRSLLKRYNYFRSLEPLESLNVNNWYTVMYRTFIYPQGPGPSYGSSIASAMTPIAGPTNYNLVPMTMMRYCMQAYVGFRGGCRWKVLYCGTNNQLQPLSVGRNPEYLSNESQVNIINDNGSYSLSRVVREKWRADNCQDSAAGTALTGVATQPGLEYELPFQTALRYAECNEPGDTEVPPYTGLNQGSQTVSFDYRETANQYHWLQFYTAAAEDFSLFFFIGAPARIPSDVNIVTL